MELQSNWLRDSMQVADLIACFREGNRDRAFFGLLESGREVIPELVGEFRAESDSNVRAFLVEVIWQKRDPTAVQFLSEALSDPAPDVWKQAIDGLVTLGTSQAVGALEAARQRQFTREQDRKEFPRWLDEAIGQASRLP